MLTVEQMFGISNDFIDGDEDFTQCFVHSVLAPAHRELCAIYEKLGLDFIRSFYRYMAEDGTVPVSFQEAKFTGTHSALLGKVMGLVKEDVMERHLENGGTPETVPTVTGIINADWDVVEQFLRQYSDSPDDWNATLNLVTAGFETYLVDALENMIRLR